MKADLLFGGMHIDVQQRRINLNENHRLRIAPLHETLSVTFYDRSGQHSVSDASLVHIHKNTIALAPAHIRRRQVDSDSRLTELAIPFRHRCRHVTAEKCGKAI